MFHVTFNVEDKDLGEILKLLNLKIKAYNVTQEYIPNVDVKDDKVIVAYHNSNELVIKHIIKNNLDFITTEMIGELLESAGYARGSKGGICSDLVKAGMLQRIRRGSYKVDLDHAMLGGPLFSKENSNEETSPKGNEVVQKLQLQGEGSSN